MKRTTGPSIDPDQDDVPFPGLSALKQITPPASLVPGVMQRIAEPRPLTIWGWLRRPRRLELRVSPLGGLLIASAAGLALFAVALSRPQGAAPVAGLSTAPAVASSGERLPSAGAADAPVVLVRFVLAAKGARKVSVAGDFNAWNPGETVLVDADGQGTFVATVPLRKGSYEYMFLVDGKWMTDPGAAEVRPDGFGRSNAILRL